MGPLRSAAAAAASRHANDGGLGFVRRLLQPLRDPSVMQTSESRHEWLEALCDTRPMRAANIIPMIVVMAVACKDLIAAVWSAWAITLLVWVLEAYRHRYNPLVVFPNLIGTTSLTVYTLFIILMYTNSGFTPTLVSPVLISALCGVVIVSLCVRRPFTAQHAATRVSEEVRRSDAFLRLNMALTAFWAVLFSIMTVSVWCSYAFFRSDDCATNAGSIVLGTVIPIVLPVLGFAVTPYLVEWLKGRGVAGGDKDAQQAKKDRGDDAEAVGETDRLLGGSSALQVA